MMYRVYPGLKTEELIINSVQVPEGACSGQKAVLASGPCQAEPHLQEAGTRALRSRGESERVRYCTSTRQESAPETEDVLQLEQGAKDVGRLGN